jgi:hypothetical protein
MAILPDWIRVDTPFPYLFPYSKLTLAGRSSHLPLDTLPLKLYYQGNYLQGGLIMAVDGTYNVEMTTPRGTQTGTITLKAAGNAVSGTYTTPRGAQNFTGTIDGDNVAWSLNVPSPMGGQLTLAFKVKVAGNALSGTVQLGQFGSAPIKVTKTA